jgi:hypothetical protein
LIAVNSGGVLCFWFPRQEYWQGFNVKVYVPYATVAANRVTSIVDAGQPGSNKLVNLSANIRQSLHTGNYNSYVPTLTGGNASGTWGINITGNANTVTSVPWTSVTGKPNVVVNDGGNYGINITGNANSASIAPQISNRGTVTAESNGAAESRVRFGCQHVGEPIMFPRIIRILPFFPMPGVCWLLL